MLRYNNDARLRRFADFLATMPLDNLSQNPTFSAFANYPGYRKVNSFEECFSVPWVSGYESFEEVKGIADGMSSDTIDGRMRALFSLIRRTGVSSGSLLAIGCGVGLHRRAMELLGLGLEYWGCDPSEFELQIAQKLFNDTQRFQLVNGEKLTYGDGAFKISIFEGSLQYIPDFVSALREGVRVSSKWIIIHNVSVVLDQPTLYFHRDVSESKVMPDRSFNEDQLIEEAASAGTTVRTMTTLDARCVAPGHILLHRTYLLEKKS